ncbi:MAG: hypothetical protein RL603_741 [Pseudomonadota bacterium]|jgi:hypothetical protein
MSHSIWIFLHILLLVYWLGADLGVLLLARAAKRPELSFAERAFALRMAMVIDLVPRICFTLMFPVGLHVTASGGFAVVPEWAFVLAWAVCLGWLALLAMLGKHEGTATGERLGTLHLCLQAVLMIVLGALGISALLGMGALPGGWFGAKILLFAGIFAMGIGIDFAFRPVGPAFARLATEGSSPELESTIGGAIDGAIRYVLGLYALLILIAFLGVTKFL